MVDLNVARIRTPQSETSSHSVSRTGVTSVNRSTKRGNQKLQATYNDRDPRPFYRCQKELDYQIPALCGVLVRTLAQEFPSHPGVTVVDMGCSYGIGSAAITCDLTLEEVYDNYVRPDRAALSIAELRTADRRWFDRHRSVGAVRMFGFDVSANAVRFACGVGLLDRGWVCDLERQEPPPGLASAMREVNLIVGCGIFSYITPLTVDRLLAARRGVAPWMLSFPLRLSDYRSFATALSQHGLRTMRLNKNAIVQQRVGEGEQHLIAEYTGQRPCVVSRNGHTYYLADCFLSVPDGQVDAAAGLAARLRHTLDRSPLVCVT